jgi:hypothetical protein
MTLKYTISNFALLRESSSPEDLLGLTLYEITARKKAAANSWLRA